MVVALQKYRAAALTAALVLGILVIIAVTAELFLREHYRDHDEAIRTGMKLLWSPLYASIAEPNSSGMHSTGEFSVSLRSNSEGFRERELVEGENVDVAVIGDSYVWGTGAEEESRFTNLLQDRFADLSVANYGLCTAGTLNELAVYRDFVQQRRPTLVMLVFFGNDIQNNLWWMADLQAKEKELTEAINAAFEERRRSVPTWPDGGNIVLKEWYSSALLHFLSTQWERASQNVRNIILGPPVTTVETADGEVEVSAQIARGDSNWAPVADLALEPVEQGWVVTSAALEMLKQEVEADGGRLAIVYLPYQERVHPEQWPFRKRIFGLVFPDKLVDFDRPRNRLQKIAQALEVEFVDLTEPLSAAAQTGSEPLYYPIDGHLTRRGHEVVAESLARWLARTQPVIDDGGGNPSTRR